MKVALLEVPLYKRSVTNDMLYDVMHTIIFSSFLFTVFIVEQ